MSGLSRARQETHRATKMKNNLTKIKITENQWNYLLEHELMATATATAATVTEERKQLNG